MDNLLFRRVFKPLGVEYSKEVSTGITELDYYLPAEKLVIEVEGSVHYYGLTKHRNAKKRLKDRLLHAAGLKVLYLPHFDYKVEIDGKYT